MKLKWKDAIEISLSQKVVIRATSTVCSLHFPADSYDTRKSTTEKGNRLKPGAIPSIFVNSRGELLVYESEISETEKLTEDLHPSPSKKQKLNTVIDLTDQEIDSMELDGLRSTLKKAIKTLKETSAFKKSILNKMYYQSNKKTAASTDQDVK